MLTRTNQFVKIKYALRVMVLSRIRDLSVGFPCDLSGCGNSFIIDLFC